MNRQSFQKKRRSIGGTGLFVLHSKTRRHKKRRVAASADLGSEVPNLGVARALFVILVLHVAAIAAIFIHNRVNNSGVASAEKDTTQVSSAFATQPKAASASTKGEHFYFVATGDTYERIARLKNVDLNELRELNKNKGLGHGAILRIPANKLAAPVAVASVNPEPASGTEGSPVAPLNPVSAVERPDVAEATTVEPAVDAGNQPQGASERTGTPDAGIPVRVTPNRNPSVAVAVPVSAETAGSETYIVKTGDTPWGIARKHGVSVQDLLEANNIKDARKMRVSMKLRLPVR